MGGGSLPYSPSAARTSLPRRAHQSSWGRKGSWGSGVRRGEPFASPARGPARSCFSPLTLAGCCYTGLVARLPRRPGGGRGRASAQNGSCPSSEASGEGEGRGEGCEPRRRLLGSPSSLALTGGRGAPWGGLRARWGRGASARPRRGEEGPGAARGARSRWHALPPLRAWRKFAKVGFVGPADALCFGVAGGRVREARTSGQEVGPAGPGTLVASLLRVGCLKRTLDFIFWVVWLGGGRASLGTLRSHVSDRGVRRPSWGYWGGQSVLRRKAGRDS